MLSYGKPFFSNKYFQCFDQFRFLAIYAKRRQQCVKIWMKPKTKNNSSGFQDWFYLNAGLLSRKHFRLTVNDGTRCEKEGGGVHALNDWKNEFLRIVDKRIENYYISTFIQTAT